MTRHRNAVALAYRPPYDWVFIRDYLAARATPGVEIVQSNRYWRTVRMGEHRGIISVGPPSEAGGGRRRHALRLELTTTLVPALLPLIASVRRLFDLDAHPAAIEGDLRRDPILAKLIARRPGLRVAGALDPFELTVRAVLGQQITVRGASTLAGRLATLAGEPLPPELRVMSPLTHFAVTAERLATLSAADVRGIGLPPRRAECLVHLTRAVIRGRLKALTVPMTVGNPAAVTEQLMRIPGVGPWTAAYVAMRAFHWPDAFPEGDLGLRRAVGGATPRQLLSMATRWRPWRAYAAQHLWASLAERQHESWWLVNS